MLVTHIKQGNAFLAKDLKVDSAVPGHVYFLSQSLWKGGKIQPSANPSPLTPHVEMAPGSHMALEKEQGGKELCCKGNQQMAIS